MPGKVLAPIVGRPLLWHVLHRLSKCASVHESVVATSNEEADDPIAAFCAVAGVTCVRGPEDNVLARYDLAAMESQADIVVRVTADAPLIDPGFVDFLVQGLIRSGADFVMMRDDEPVAHEGADPFTRRALSKLAREAGCDPVAREHVSAYFKAHQDFVPIARLDPPAALRFRGARLSVDTPADATFIEAVYEKLQAQAGEANLTDLIALMRRDPTLLGLNAHVVQKKATDASTTVLMRCDGGAALGLGHVKRSLALARQFRDRHGFGVRFAVSEDGAARALAEAAGFPVSVKPPAENEATWLTAVCASAKASAAIFDTRTADGAAAVIAARASGAVTAVIDDASDRRLHADLAFYPPAPQAAALAWEGSRTQRMTGWEWAILGETPGPRQPRDAGAPSTVLITMGGSDPLRLTLRAAKAAAAVLGTHRILVAIGPGVADSAGLVQALRRLPGPLTIVEACNDLRPLMAQADVAVSAFGVTAYELAAHGVPALYLHLTPDHGQSASAFEAAGIGRSIGPASGPDAAIEDALAALLRDASAREAMRRAGLAAVDGRGAERIAALIADKIGTKAKALRRAR
jgi:spore coat polysaccharide biosynthesis protein SpsF